MRAKLVRKAQRALVAADGVRDAALPLVDRADDAQAFDLAPPIAAGGEVAEGRARAVGRADEVTERQQSLRRIQGREGDELLVAAGPRHAQRLLEDLPRQDEVATVERHPALVVQRGRLAERVSGAAEVSERLGERALGSAEAPLLSQDRPDVLQRDAAHARVVTGREHALEQRQRVPKLPSAHEDVRLGDDGLRERLLQPRGPGDLLGPPGRLDGRLPVAPTTLDARLVRQRLCKHRRIGSRFGGEGSCADRTPTAPADPGSGELLGGLFSPSRTLIECPTSVTKSTSGTIDPLGGSTTLDGTIVSLPAGAVLTPTTVELTIPASRYMEIGITANGGHFVFELPIVVGIDYSRCNQSDLLLQPLTVWYIDSETKELKHHMGGIDDKTLQRITFTTDHLSGYAIAF